MSQTTIKKNVQRVQNGRTKEAGKTVRSQEEISESATLEAVHVQRVYDQIAPHIQDLKQKTWPRVKDFLASLEPGSLVADVGKFFVQYFETVVHFFSSILYHF